MPKDLPGEAPREAPLSYESLLELARRSEGKVLKTATGKEFTVGIYMDAPFFTPASSGLGQADGRPAMRRFVERYNETGSLRPADYADVTRNASYFIGLLLEEEERSNRPRIPGGDPSRP